MDGPNETSTEKSDETLPNINITFNYGSQTDTLFSSGNRCICLLCVICGATVGLALANIISTIVILSIFVLIIRTGVHAPSLGRSAVLVRLGFELFRPFACDVPSATNNTNVLCC